MYLTERELLTKQQEQLFGIQKVLTNSDISLDDIAALIPGRVHLNRIHSLDLVYFDKQSRELLEVKKEDMAMNGRQILMDIAKPESFRQAKELFGKMDFEDASLVGYHFQSLKGLPDKNKYKWYYSTKKRFNDTLILTVSNPVSSLGPMQKQMEKVLEQNLFIRKNLARVNSLSRREKEIMRLIARGYSSRQIAEQLFISPHTVNTHRKNIWYKLDINSYAELLKFARQFELF